MKRYHYEREGDRFSVRDRLRGFPSVYDPEARRAVARCWSVDDAEAIVDALNAAEPSTPLIDQGVFG